MNAEHINEKVEIARVAGAGVGVTMYGLTLNEWVAAATLIYLTAQIIILLPKAVKTVRSFWSGE
jgi:hypothetical protein